MITDLVTNYDNKDFEKCLIIQVYIDGFIFLEGEEKNFEMSIKMRDLEIYKKEKVQIIRPQIEEKIKKYIIQKIKEKFVNIVELSRKYKVEVKHLLHCYFINNRIENIEIQWAGRGLKEFQYVPIEHYFEYEDDFILLKTKGFKFKRKL